MVRCQCRQGPKINVSLHRPHTIHWWMLLLLRVLYLCNQLGDSCTWLLLIVLHLSNQLGESCCRLLLTLMQLTHGMSAGVVRDQTEERHELLIMRGSEWSLLLLLGHARRVTLRPRAGDGGG